VTELESDSPEETERLAARVAAALVPGDVVLVQGELGSGKTTSSAGRHTRWASRGR
jgi:tRNA threonylcarbamoyladenosine biosynthesis protein TsaE